MKPSEKFLQEHTEEYANFLYKDEDGGGTYSTPGIEIEYLEEYIRLLKEEWEAERMLPLKVSGECPICHKSGFNVIYHCRNCNGGIHPQAIIK